MCAGYPNDVNGGAMKGGTATCERFPVFHVVQFLTSSAPKAGKKTLMQYSVSNFHFHLMFRIYLSFISHYTFLQLPVVSLDTNECITLTETNMRSAKCAERNENKIRNRFSIQLKGAEVHGGVNTSRGRNIEWAAKKEEPHQTLVP